MGVHFTCQATRVDETRLNEWIHESQLVSYLSVIRGGRPLNPAQTKYIIRIL